MTLVMLILFLEIYCDIAAFTATLIVIFLCEKGTSLWNKRKGNLKIYILGALGIANMWIAIFADVGVMVLAVLNAVRALKI